MVITIRIEAYMNKVIGELKAITDTKWNKNIRDLDIIGDATWPDVDTNITI